MSDVIGQNIEYDDQKYNKSAFEKMLKYGCEFPLWIKDIAESSPIFRVINAGVLGGQDITFIQEYVELVKKFIHAMLIHCEKSMTDLLIPFMSSYSCTFLL